MFARVSTLRVPPDRVGEGIRYVRERLLPRARQMEGFEGPYLLVDRDRGKALMVGLWESEEAMRSSEELAAGQRAETTQNLGVDVVSVDKYEVVLSPEEGVGQEAPS